MHPPSSNNGPDELGELGPHLVPPGRHARTTRFAAWAGMGLVAVADARRESFLGSRVPPHCFLAAADEVCTLKNSVVQHVRHSEVDSILHLRAIAGWWCGGPMITSIARDPLPEPISIAPQLRWSHHAAEAFYCHQIDIISLLTIAETELHIKSVE